MEWISCKDFIEIPVRWQPQFEEGEIEAYKVIHGDDRSKWPGEHEIASLTFSIDKLVCFNPHSNKDLTTFHLQGIGSFVANIPYEVFKTMMDERRGVEIFECRYEPPTLPQTNNQ